MKINECVYLLVSVLLSHCTSFRGEEMEEDVFSGEESYSD